MSEGGAGVRKGAQAEAYRFELVQYAKMLDLGPHILCAARARVEANRRSRQQKDCGTWPTRVVRKGSGDLGASGRMEVGTAVDPTPSAS